MTSLVCDCSLQVVTSATYLGKRATDPRAGSKHGSVDEDWGLWVLLEVNSDVNTLCPTLFKPSDVTDLQLSMPLDMLCRRRGLVAPVLELSALARSAVDCVAQLPLRSPVYIPTGVDFDLYASLVQ